MAGAGLLFDEWQDLEDEPTRRKTLQQESFLPLLVKGRTDYKIADLYATKAPPG